MRERLIACHNMVLQELRAPKLITKSSDADDILMTVIFSTSRTVE
jgi:hypothetical protein